MQEWIVRVRSCALQQPRTGPRTHDPFLHQDVISPKHIAGKPYQQLYNLQRRNIICKVRLQYGIGQNEPII
jgi:hypothetical protein